MTVSEEMSRSESREYPASIWRNWNFLRLISGRLVTNAGDSLYSVATLWLVYDLSGSNAITGVASSLLLLPFLLQIVSGPIVDRLPLKPILTWTQFAQGVIILVLPLAAYTGNLTVGLILLTIPALSLVNQMVFPAQAAALPRIVADDQLTRSNSALATVTHGLDMIFEAFGGILIALFGITVLFLLDSVTFLVAGLLFMGMVIPAAEGSEEDEETEDGAGYFDDLRTGIETLRGTVFVDMILTAAVFNFAVGATLAILPAFGELRGGPAVYGLMLGALGTGRLLGSASASYLEGLPYGRLKAATYAVSAVLWFASVYSRTAWAAVVLFGLAWISAGIDGVMVATLTQKVVPDHLLGRISSVKGTASAATLPIGSLVGGVIAEFVGTTTMMGIAACGFGFAGIYFASRTALRRLPSVEDVEPSDFGLDDAANAAG